jgi:HemY protein
VSERWLPVSPISGRIDAFEWKVPLAEIGERPEVEMQAETAPVIDATPPARPAEIDSDRSEEKAPAPASILSRRVRKLRAAQMRREPVPEAVVPLVHVPDDPGPGAEPEREPMAEGTTLAPASGWRRIFSW